MGDKVFSGGHNMNIEDKTQSCHPSTEGSTMSSLVTRNIQIKLTSLLSIMDYKEKYIFSISKLNK